MVYTILGGYYNMYIMYIYTWWELDETKIWMYNVWCTCMWCKMLNHILIYTYFKCFDNSILIAILVILSYTGYFDTGNTIGYGWISHEKIVRNYRIATFYLLLHFWEK